MTFDPTPLVEAAKKATPGEWPKKVINWPRRSYLALGSCEAAGPAHMHASCGDDELAHAQAEKDAAYIVAAQPRNILALVDTFQRDAAAKDAEIARLREQHATDLRAARAEAAREMREKAAEAMEQKWAEDADRDPDNLTNIEMREAKHVFSAPDLIRAIPLPAEDAAALAEFEARVRAEENEACAALLNAKAKRLRELDAEERGIPKSMGVSHHADTLDGAAAALRARRGGG